MAQPKNGFQYEIRRLPNDTIKQLAVHIETLVRKAYSLNTHDYKNTKMTEILMMTLTPQLRKIAIKKRASHICTIYSRISWTRSAKTTYISYNFFSTSNRYTKSTTNTNAKPN